MNSFAILIWIAGGLLLAIWLGVAWHVGCGDFLTRRRWRGDTERLLFFRILFVSAPMILLLSVFGIFVLLLQAPYALWRFAVERKPLGELRQ
jgi:hypothetical protein